MRRRLELGLILMTLVVAPLVVFVAAGAGGHRQAPPRFHWQSQCPAGSYGCLYELG